MRTDTYQLIRDKAPSELMKPLKDIIDAADAVCYNGIAGGDRDPDYEEYMRVLHMAILAVIEAKVKEK